ncbi:MAG: hypothetical protein ACE5EU_07890 [Paracoccaceae bacterium]
MAIAVAAAAAGAAAGLRQAGVSDAERAMFSETCEYYRTRAGPARQSAPGEFVVFLADICAGAQITLDTGTREQRSRAALLLSRIVLLRETVGLMNAERWARVPANSGGVVMPSPVTPSGEFLIAHRMGLMRAYDAWLDSGVDFSLASER